MIDSLSLVLRLRPGFYPVFGSNWTQIGPKFLRARIPQCSTELLTLNERNRDVTPTIRLWQYDTDARPALKNKSVPEVLRTNRVKSLVPAAPDFILEFEYMFQFFWTGAGRRPVPRLELEVLAA